MKKSDRPCYIVGNWKMYKTRDEALRFIDKIAPLADSANCQVLLAVPFTAIDACAKRATGSKIIIGAQNMNDATEGAFTGEIAASMLKDAGANFVILGHSERRKIFGETNAFINRKVKRAIASDLKALLCIGETYDERQKEETEAVLEKQLQECLDGVEKTSQESLLVCYEPIWAVGTGKPATAESAAQAHGFCRKVLENLWGKRAAGQVPILYGGSVTSENAESYLDTKDIDGLLIGSASLNPDSFAKIIQLRQNVAQV